MLDIARKYLKAGFSVIPLSGKLPALSSWKEYQTRYPTDDELVKWFPDNKVSIGIVTGKLSDITVVDIDAKSGGLETLKELHLPITWIVKTGGGGWHYYYKYTKEVGQSQSIYRGIDIRNDGGYVVAPPSYHSSGFTYEWKYKEDELVEFPVHLFGKVEAVKKDWSDIVSNGVGEGNRNGLASSLFGKLFTMFKPEEWESIVWPIGLNWNLKNNPPLSEKELRTVFESIAKRAINNKRVPTLYEILSNNSTPIELAKRIKEKNKEVKKFFSWGDAYLDEVFPLIEQNNYMVLFGQFSSGKTTFAMFMAKANSTAGHKVSFLTLEMSKDLLIKQYAFKKAGVSKLDYKSGEYDDSIFEQYADDLKNIEFIGIEEGSEKTEYTLQDIEEIIKEKTPDILFIDNFNKLKGMGKTEIDIDNKTSSALLFLTRKYKTTIIILHHANKPSKEKKKSILKGIGGMRGTNKINDDADIVVEIGRPTEEQLLNYPPNMSMVGVYKDRNWDCRGAYNLLFENGIFYEQNNKDYNLNEIANSFGGEIIKF